MEATFFFSSVLFLFWFVSMSALISWRCMSCSISNIVRSDFADSLSKRALGLISLFSLVVLHGLGFPGEDRDGVVFFFLLFVGSHGTSENIFVFLIGEVNIIVSVRVRVFGWVVSVILPDAV